MTLDRTGWLAVIVLALLGVGTFAVVRWPDPAPALPCPPHEVRWVDGGSAGFARCGTGGGGEVLPAGAALTLGGKLDLNEASAADLSLIPGVGPSLAEELIRARTRLGRFTDWNEVDAVRGVGPARLDALQNATEIRGSADPARP